MPTPTCVGLATRLPPTAASYHVIVPPVAVAVNVCVNVPSEHTVWLLADGAAGAAFIVNVTAVLVTLEQVPSDACA